MKILFSPEYSGRVFTKPESGIVMMDTIVANTIGLVEVLELRLGLHHETPSPQQDLVRYYDAMNRYTQSRPDNCFAESFQVSGLKTARAVKAWRDELRMAGWDGLGGNISDRLKALAGIEEIYSPIADKDLADRAKHIVERLQKQQYDCSDMELALNCNPAWLRPLEKSLIDALKTRGAKVSLLPMAEGDKTNLDIVRRMMIEGTAPKTLNSNDNSLLIYRFSDHQQANEYLASANLCGADVCIDSDNKALDHQMKLMGRLQTGSATHNSAPQLTQLLVVGVSLFYPTLNINTLLQWLDMPLHPLPVSLRRDLSYAIIREGGYRNDRCRRVLEDYFAGKYEFLSEEELKLPEEEQAKLRRKGESKRHDKYNRFLPHLVHCGENPRHDDLKCFTESLLAWCRMSLLMDGNAQWRDQLLKVKDMTETFSMLLDTESSETVDTKTMDSWLGALDKTGEFTGSLDEKDCTIVVSKPAHIVSISNKTLWANFNGNDTVQFECSFLSPSEKEKLSSQGHIALWGDNEILYHNHQQLMTLLHTSRQIILVVCEQQEGDPTPKHPLLVRLEQHFGENGLAAVTSHPAIESSMQTPVTKVSNEQVEDVLEFDHADKIEWPSHLYPTGIEKIIEEPFDYTMESLLKIKQDDRSLMNKTAIVTGNVAHRVIETFFAPENDKKPKSVKAIENEIEQHYDNVFTGALNARGAILLLPENRIEMLKMHIQLRRCMKTLCEIIRDNGLRVMGCEVTVRDGMGFGLPEEVDPETGKVFDVKGDIDMVLEDSEGHPVIFDFKWSTKPEKYRDRLVKNDSIQLELYRRMLYDNRQKEVRRVAYFVMPKDNGRLYSLEKFKGDHCIQIEPKEIVDVAKHTVERVKDYMKTLSGGQAEVTFGDYSDYTMFAKKAKKTTKKSK